jgi:hypothetical protein
MEDLLSAPAAFDPLGSSQTRNTTPLPLNIRQHQDDKRSGRFTLCKINLRPARFPLYVNL